jgi:hypothetical protein
MAGALFFTLAAAAYAQDPSPVDITISGKLDLTWASRDRVINEASLWTPGGLAPGSPLRTHDTFVLPEIAVRFDIESSPVRAAVEIGNPVLHADSADPRLQEDRLGEARALPFRLRQAWLELFDALRIGQQDFLWDPTGLGQPLFLAPSGSESPWLELPDSTVPPFPASGTNTVPQTRRDRTYPVGLTARVDDLVLFALLMGEGGPPSADEGLYGAAVSRQIDWIRGGAVATLLSGPERRQEVWTGGLAVAADLKPFTLAIEGYRQFGRAGEGLRAAGSAVRASARVEDGVWAQATFIRLSGDRRGDDRREGRFLAYEDNDATLIVEGNEFGLDVDTNYWSAQVSSGISVEILEKRFRPRLTAAFFRFLEPVPLPPDPAPGVSGRSRDLGVEIDAGGELDWSSHLSFTAGAAMLFGAGALQEFTRTRDDRALLFTLGLRLGF